MVKVTLGEQVYKLHKQHMSPMDISFQLKLSFKQVIHLIESKPKKSINEGGKSVRIWK